ncbi:hypothetical protein PI125_g2094 [Phytophthora idaei]|nr:hypothetical protein PI125_g2094 [Phytophthora idaei]
MDDVPGEVDAPTISGSEGPLNEDDLPETSFLERRTIGDEETAISGVNYPIMDIVAKRVEARQVLLSRLSCYPGRRFPLTFDSGV